MSCTGAVIEKWENNSWKEFYNSKANNALKIYKYVSENEEPYYGWVDFNGVNSYSVGDVRNPIGYADYANITPISGEWENTTSEQDEWEVDYKAARIPRNGMCLLKINFGNISFISLINYIELNAVTKEAKYTYLQTIRWTDGDVIISRPIYAKHMWLSSGNKVAVVFGDFSSDNSFTKEGYLDDFQYKIIT